MHHDTRVCGACCNALQHAHAIIKVAVQLARVVIIHIYLEVDTGGASSPGAARLPALELAVGVASDVRGRSRASAALAVHRLAQRRGSCSKPGKVLAKDAR